MKPAGRLTMGVEVEGLALVEGGEGPLLVEVEGVDGGDGAVGAGARVVIKGCGTGCSWPAAWCGGRWER